MILKILIYFINDLIEKGIYCHIVQIWDLSHDGPIANVLMHIIIYSIVYGKKNVFVFVSVALDFTFILVSKLQLNFGTVKNSPDFLLDRNCPCEFA